MAPDTCQGLYKVSLGSCKGGAFILRVSRNTAVSSGWILMPWMLTLRCGLFLPYFMFSNYNFVAEKQCWGDAESEAKKIKRKKK